MSIVDEAIKFITDELNIKIEEQEKNIEEKQKIKNEFEELQSRDAENPKCPECNSDTDKLISHFMGIIKGSSNALSDCKIGADAERRWNGYYDKKAKQRKLKEVK